MRSLIITNPFYLIIHISVSTSTPRIFENEFICSLSLIITKPILSHHTQFRISTSSSQARSILIYFTHYQILPIPLHSILPYVCRSQGRKRLNRSALILIFHILFICITIPFQYLPNWQFLSSVCRCVYLYFRDER